MMSPQIEKIANPLIKHNLFDSVEAAFETVTLNYTQEQINKYNKIIKKFEREYNMNYAEFVKFTKKKAKQLISNSSLHTEIVKLENDAFDWKVAENGFESWQQVHQEILACLH